MRYPKFDIATSGIGSWLVNGQEVSGDTSDYLHDITAYEVISWGSSACLYCKTSLDATEFEDIAANDDEWHNNRSYVLQRCRRCAYWEFQGFEGGNRCMDFSQAILVASVAAKFSDELPEGCSEELAQHLRRNPMHWHDLSPTRMETLVTDIFRANYQHSEVIHVGAPGDRGIDIMFVDSNSVRWLIQVKRRAKPNKAEGFSTLQSILGTLILEGERHGMIVSTADHFSYQAKKEVERARQRGYVVELLDKGILDRMIGALLPQTPLQELFAQPSLKHIDNDVRQHFIGGEPDPKQLTLF